jgi:hypothetical protein
MEGDWRGLRALLVEEGLTENERRVGLLEAGKVPKVGRLTELVALTSGSVGIGMRMSVAKLDSQDSFQGKGGSHHRVSQLMRSPRVDSAHLHSCI